MIKPKFTMEQENYICYQIGDWYLKWRNNIAVGEGIGHRLGVAKEDLKVMICGDDTSTECENHLWSRGKCFDCGKIKGED